MVIAKHHSSEWLPVLRTASPWSPPPLRTVVVAPHPDDESLACGGLIAGLRAGGVDVLVAAVTDGENAYADGVPIRQTRQLEQELALGKLGVDPEKIVRFRLPDSGVQSLEASLEDALLTILDCNTHVIAPWTHDFHPDHEACGRAAQAAASKAGAALTFYLFWTFHRGSPSLLQSLNLLSLPLAESQQRQKIEAVLCHKSQLKHSSGEPILPEDLLWPTQLSFEVYIRP